MMKSHLIMKAISILLIGFSSTGSHAAFIGRLETSPSSGIFQAYYDDQLDVTWAASANISGIPDTWGKQVEWVAGLTLGGISGWRLPNVDVNGDGSVVSCVSVTQSECKDNEYSHLYWYGAGATYGSGVTPSNPTPFSDFQADYYWSSTVYALDSNAAWFFSTSGGVGPGPDAKSVPHYAWAIHSGDVGTIPLPATVYLFCSGLVALTRIARCKRA